MKKLILILCLLLIPSLSWGIYTIDSTRTITWANNCGLDPVGGIDTTGWTITTLPTSPTITSTVINTAISNASANTVIVIPAGVYTISSLINMKSNVVLRGAKPIVATASTALPAADGAATTLNLGSSAYIRFGSQTKADHWTPGINQGTDITSGFTKDSTRLYLDDVSGYAMRSIARWCDKMAKH